MGEDEKLTFAGPEEEIEHWKLRAEELELALAEAQNNIEEFQIESQELEKELENELKRAESKNKELVAKCERLANESEDWKQKYQKCKTETYETVQDLQREIDNLKTLEQTYRTRTRELEQDNDDLERIERVATTSLADMETRYNRVLERNVYLENELEEKQELIVEIQRLKDELRDTKHELSLFRDPDLIANRQASSNKDALETSSGSSSAAVESSGINGINSSSSSSSGGSNSGEAKKSDASDEEKTTWLRSKLDLPPSLTSTSPVPISPTAIAPLSAAEQQQQPISATAKAVGDKLAGAEEVSSGPPSSPSPVRMVQEMLKRIKTLEQRLSSCRSIVAPLLETKQENGDAPAPYSGRRYSGSRRRAGSNAPPPVENGIIPENEEKPAMVAPVG